MSSPTEKLRRQNPYRSEVCPTLSMFSLGVNRNSVAQFGYSLVATAYQNDSLGTILDPDNIGA